MWILDLQNKTSEMETSPNQKVKMMKESSQWPWRQFNRNDAPL